MILGLEKGGGDEQRPEVSILDDNKKAALACIKKYLTEDYDKHEKCILKLSEMDNEVEVKAILAVHLFAPLIPDLPDTDQYGIDNEHFPKDEQQRKCPSCGQKLRFTDTSFGNIEVWHGNADMILNKCTVTVNKEYDEARRSTRHQAEHYDSDSDASVSSSSSFSFVEVKCHEKAGEKQLCRQEEAEAQAIAQTITNAFCEESNRDELIPSFLATNEKVKIYMYCCSKDVLLESNYIPICPNGSLSIKTLVLVWLALNFDFYQVSDVFGEKFRDRLEYELPLSNFHKIVGEDALKLYQHEASRHLIKKTR
ncbi:uncharacterized protein LOC132750835 [Ruditapes philippinarum]|uniref:uncharacterized protein LOC132750835 n=1 Tax=Ruditapes philippinarum TaxID=129788 RepID=UPI00295A6721|nr:uncharacterized protein LOC132750835 [Ruditapes philippinarum]